MLNLVEGGPVRDILPAGSDFRVRDIMTLIVALVGNGEAVLAADSQISNGDANGYYASTINKLKLVNDRWILGVAGKDRKSVV